MFTAETVLLIGTYRADTWKYRVSGGSGAKNPPIGSFIECDGARLHGIEREQ
jgi:hypothetical protein